MNKKTAIAALLLAAGSAVFAYGLREQLFGVREVGPETFDDPSLDLPPMEGGPKSSDDAMMPGDDEGAASVSDGRRASSVDLLAKHGSLEQLASVNASFRNRFADQAQMQGDGSSSATNPAPAPLGETLRDGWKSDEWPSEHRISLVMMTGVPRAVVDGRVVGVGDAIAAGTVTAIDAHGVEVDTGSRHLYYDLVGPYPREFRSELQRRSAQQQERPTERGASSQPTQEPDLSANRGNPENLDPESVTESLPSSSSPPWMRPSTNQSSKDSNR